MAVLELKGRLVGMAKDLLSKTERLTLTFAVDPEETEYLSYFRQDEDLRLGIKKWFPKRSVSANNLFWGCVGDLVAHLRGNNPETKEEDVYFDLLRNYGVCTKVLVEPSFVEHLRKEWKLVDEGPTVTVGGKPYVECSCYYGTSSYTSDEFARLMNGTLEEMKACELVPPSKADVVASLAVWKAMNAGESSFDECKGNVYDESRGDGKESGKKKKKTEEPVAAAGEIPDAVPDVPEAPEKAMEEATAASADPVPVNNEVSGADPDAAFRSLPGSELSMTEVDALFAAASSEEKPAASSEPQVSAGTRRLRIQRRA